MGWGIPLKFSQAPNYVDSDTDIETIPPHIPNLDEYCQTAFPKRPGAFVGHS